MAGKFNGRQICFFPFIFRLFHGQSGVKFSTPLGRIRFSRERNGYWNKKFNIVHFLLSYVKIGRAAGNRVFSLFSRREEGYFSAFVAAIIFQGTSRPILFNNDAVLSLLLFVNAVSFSTGLFTETTDSNCAISVLYFHCIWVYLFRDGSLATCLLDFLCERRTVFRSQFARFSNNFKCRFSMSTR